MAIIKKESQVIDNIDIEINNGDLIALREVVEKWKFKNEESALRFAIAVLKVTKPGDLLQMQEDGSQSPLKPTSNITKQKEV